MDVNLIFIIIFFLYNFFYKNVYFCYCSEYSKTIDLKIKGIFTIKFIEHDLQNPNDFNHCGIHCLLFLENLLQDLNLSHLQYNAEDLKSKRITVPTFLKFKIFQFSSIIKRCQNIRGRS